MQHIPGLRSTIDSLRDRFAPVRHTSTFRQTGEITPEEFLLAGDYLVHKFPSWAWAPAGNTSRVASYLPREKQYLVTKHVPCNRRVNGDDFVGGEEKVLFLGGGVEGGEGEGDGWVSTGGGGDDETAKKVAAEAARKHSQGLKEDDVEEEEEEDIPDMDASDDEAAVIRETHNSASGNDQSRTYNLYITYTPYYRTPRLYLSGFSANHTPLPPLQMLEDIVGDYSDKTVTLEDFPFFDAQIKMASVHPCRHAAVMKVLLDRAEKAVQLRKDKLRERDGRAAQQAAAVAGAAGPGLEGLVEGVGRLDVAGEGRSTSGTGTKGQEKDGDEWEVLQAGGGENEDEGAAADDAAAIQVHQYVVVFLKFMASVTPGIEHDFTMGV